MGLPATGYDIATISNPTSSITDFTLLVDLSRMSSMFKSSWNTSEQGRGRAAKLDGTELACDWINLNHAAKTGWLRVKWIGALASTGTQRLRVYPPNTENTAYAVGDPYGRNAAYSGAIAIYPFDGDAKGRSGNEYDLTVSNATQTAGKIGQAYSFNGSNSYIAEGASKIPVLAFQSGFTFHALIKPNSYGEVNLGTLLSKDDDGNGLNGIRINISSVAGNRIICRIHNVASNCLSAVNSITLSQWNTIDITMLSTKGNIYINGSLSGNADQLLSDESLITTSNPITIGNRSGATDRTFDGLIDDVQLWTGAKSTAWIGEEFAQGNDQSAFWGTWTWVSQQVSSISVGQASKLSIGAFVSI